MNLHVAGLGNADDDQQGAAADDGALKNERVLIGRLLIGPEHIEEVRSKVSPNDMDMLEHARILENIYVLDYDDRTPTKHLISAALGDVEVNGLGLEGYLSICIDEATAEMALPISGPVEAIVRSSQMRSLDAIAATLAEAPSGAQSVTDVCRQASDSLDKVMAAYGAANRPGVDAAQMADAAMRSFRGEREMGPQTGFQEIDEMIGCWPLAQLSIIAARPSMGKSTLMTNAAVNLANQDIDVLIFSIEMTHVQLGQRVLCDLAYTNPDPVEYRNAGHRALSSREANLLEQGRKRLAKMPIYVHDMAGFTIDDIADLSRRRATELRNCGRRLGAIFIDHIGIMKPVKDHKGRRDREIADITSGLASLAKELNIPVIGLCQLNRGVESRDNKRPSLADLRDSGAIEEDANLVMMLYRPVYYLEKQRFDDHGAEKERQDKVEELRNKLEVGIEKNRDGKTGRVDLFANMGANAVRALDNRHGGR
jgi:replicative DNA helicase